MPHTFIIAEAGINHNGSIDAAIDLATAAYEAGADAVKFQTFWGLTNHPTLSDDELRDLEFTKQEWAQLKDYCDKVGVEFMSTPDTLEAVGFLHSLGMRKCKVGSGHLHNFAILNAIRVREWDQIIMSDGMHDLPDIKAAAFNLGFGCDSIGRGTLVLLRCISEYPASPKGMLWGFMAQPWGISDHTLGIEIPIAAVVLGISMIEKHFTLDKSLPGPDHHFSLSPGELTEMIRCIRNVELAMLRIERPTPKELELRVQLDLMRRPR